MHHFLKSSFPEILSGKPGVVFRPESQRGCSGGKCGCDDSFWGPISNNFPSSHTSSLSSCPPRFQGSQNGALQHPAVIMTQLANPDHRRGPNKQITKAEAGCCGGMTAHPPSDSLPPLTPHTCHAPPCPSYLFNSVVPPNVL